MKATVWITLISLLLINCKQAERSQPVHKEISITELEVTKILEFLASDDLNGRNTGSEGLEKAAVFIENEFKKYGIPPYFETYRDTFNARKIATQNIVGYLKGTDAELADQFVLIGAHYDHVGIRKVVNGDSIANGANDNASGSTAVISLAKHFAKTQSNKRSVLFVLFGAEEKGLLGSLHLSKKLKEQNLDLYTMLNFEMIGIPMIDKSYKAYITGHGLSNLANKMNEYRGTNFIGYSPSDIENCLFRRSDNFPFYREFKVPCHTISSFDFTNYDYFHHVDDEASKMNYTFITELISDCIPAISTIMNTTEKEIALKY